MNSISLGHVGKRHFIELLLGQFDRSLGMLEVLTSREKHSRIFEHATVGANSCDMRSRHESAKLGVNLRCTFGNGKKTCRSVVKQKAKYGRLFAPLVGSNRPISIAR